MHQQFFSLKPFPDPGSETDLAVAGLAIVGEVTWNGQMLGIHYVLNGDLTQVVIPAPQTPTRQDDLWQATCFEFFLGMQGLPGYWEFNLSPAGHWNGYRFNAYRQGMREELAFTRLPFQVKQSSEVLELMLDLDVSGLVVAAEQGLELAIATVLKHPNGEVSYWAIAHPAPEADFHHRDSFVLTL